MDMLPSELNLRLAEILKQQKNPINNLLCIHIIKFTQIVI